MKKIIEIWVMDNVFVDLQIFIEQVLCFKLRVQAVNKIVEHILENWYGRNY